MIKRIVLFPLVLFILVSCDNSKDRNFYNDGLLVKRYFYSDNVTIRAEKTFKDDTISHGYHRLFYKNGNLKQEAYFNEGEKDGIIREFYPNGVLKIKGFYKGDKPEGKWIWLYEDSVVEQTNNWSNGILTGEFIKYSKNGSIKEYAFYDPIGNAYYKRNYIDAENISEEGDKKSIVIYHSTKGLSYDIGDTLKTTIYVPSPPEFDVKLKVQLIIEGALQKEEDVLITSGKGYFESILETKGLFSFKVVQNIYDKGKNKSIVYENGFKYLVK